MVKLTDRAVDRIRSIVTEKPGAFGGCAWRLQDGGCSGYTYLLEFERRARRGRPGLRAERAKVFVHPLHLPYLAGSALDWADGELQSGFKLVNPNVKRMCGCGESFDV